MTNPEPLLNHSGVARGDVVKAWITFWVYLLVLAGVCLGGSGVFASEARGASATDPPGEMRAPAGLRLPAPSGTVPFGQ